MADFSASLLQNTVEAESWRKKYPSLPPNYVSLQQLKEKRLKEQQEQKEREEREAREQKEREDREAREQKEREEREAKEQRKRLKLEKSLQTAKTAASNRPPRTRGIYRHNLVEGSRRRSGWRGKTKFEEHTTIVVADLASLTENGGEDDVSKVETGKSAGNGKIGRGIWAIKKDGNVRIAPEIEDIETNERKEADQRPTAERKVKDLAKRRRGRSMEDKLSEKNGSKDREDRKEEAAQEIGDLKVADFDEMEKSNGRKEGDRAARKKSYRRKSGKNDGNLTVETTQNKGNVGAADFDQKVENADSGEKTEEIARKKGNAIVADFDRKVEIADDRVKTEKTLVAGKDLELGRLKEKIPGTVLENVEKDRVNAAVEIAQKIGKLEIVDFDEGNGKGVGESSLVEMIPDYGISKNERSFSFRGGFGHGRSSGYGRSGYGRSSGYAGSGYRRSSGYDRSGYGRSSGYNRTFAYGGSSGYRERRRRQPEYSMWVKKGEDLSNSGQAKIGD